MSHNCNHGELTLRIKIIVVEGKMVVVTTEIKKYDIYEKNLSNTPKLDICLILKQSNNILSLFPTNKYVE